MVTLELHLEGKERGWPALGTGVIMLYQHISWKMSYRNVSAVTVFFQKNPLYPFVQ